jgi:hypothetical protein
MSGWGPLSGVKETLVERVSMSACDPDPIAKNGLLLLLRVRAAESGPKRARKKYGSTSAIRGEADMPLM